ncbi:hypothetical protein Tco_0662429 [Tanacetum coccineum]
MSITKEQQQALDNALVPREQRLRIGNCNYKLSTTFKPKEPTFQVALDVLSLTPFYQAFLISASKFEDPPFEEEILAFIKELGYPRDITLLSDVKLKFNFIKDAKKLLEAVEKRFGGNAATRKTQRNLLK